MTASQSPTPSTLLEASVALPELPMPYDTGPIPKFSADQLQAYAREHEANVRAELARSAQAVPEGFVLVPREPTFEMISATPNGGTTVGDIYRAMLAAAPTALPEVTPQVADEPTQEEALNDAFDFLQGKTQDTPPLMAAVPATPQGQEAASEVAHRQNWTRSAIFQAAKTCEAQALETRGRSSCEIWQRHADNLNHIVKEIDATPPASAPAQTGEVATRVTEISNALAKAQWSSEQQRSDWIAYAMSLVRDLAALANSPTVASPEQAPKAITDLLREARATLWMWRDKAPAVSLIADIDKALATSQTGEQQ